ncbi:hypothetical protein [Dactylosporangium matsuzakiense]
MTGADLTGADLTGRQALGAGPCLQCGKR